MKNSINAQDDHVVGIPITSSLGPKFYQIVKRKLSSMGAKMVQGGGVLKVFRQLFDVKQQEKLLKVSQCYLSTTAGPIAGLLFISTDKLAFCSQRSLRLSSPSGELFRTPYKVIIPLTRIERANQSQNEKKSSQKYLEIVTVDGFDFWFLGFVSYQNTFNHLQHAISQL